MPPSPATPTGWSRRAASAPEAVTIRATWLRPGTTTVTVGTCCRPGRRRRRPRLLFAAAAEHARMRSTRIAIAATAAMMMFRRRRDRSTTTSVSELAKLVSRFIGRILPAIRNKRQQCRLPPLYYANKSPACNCTAPQPPLKRLFLRTAAPLTPTRVVAKLKRAWCKVDARIYHREVERDDRKLRDPWLDRHRPACRRDRQAAHAGQGPGRLPDHHPARHRRRACSPASSARRSAGTTRARPPDSSPRSSAPSSSS